MSEEADRPVVPPDLDHPVLQLLAANTSAVVGFDRRLEAVEKSVDGLASTVRSRDADIARVIAADTAERARLADETKRANDLKQRELELRAKEYGEWWQRAAGAGKSALATVKTVVSNPIIAMPIGATAYGLTKWIATAFGFDVSELP